MKVSKVQNTVSCDWTFLKCYINMILNNWNSFYHFLHKFRRGLDVVEQTCNNKHENQQYKYANMDILFKTLFHLTFPSRKWNCV